MAKELTEEEKLEIKDMIDGLVQRAKKASEEYMKLDQDTVNNIIKEMSMAGLDNHMKLAKMAVEETGRGIYEDKITKNNMENTTIWFLLPTFTSSNSRFKSSFLSLFIKISKNTMDNNKIGPVIMKKSKGFRLK